jgi:hypothetical protein
MLYNVCTENIYFMKSEVWGLWVIIIIMWEGYQPNRTTRTSGLFFVWPLPVGLSGCLSAWGSRQRSSSAVEMRFLRSTMRVTRQDRLTNEAIRKKTLNVNSLNDTISKYRDSWFNHMRRMDRNRFPRYMLSYKPTRKRSPGRPRKRWISVVWGAATDKNPMHEVKEENEEKEEVRST